jgi:hypothetical protein
MPPPPPSETRPSSSSLAILSWRRPAVATKKAKLELTREQRAVENKKWAEQRRALDQRKREVIRCKRIHNFDTPCLFYNKLWYQRRLLLLK